MYRIGDMEMVDEPTKEEMLRYWGAQNRLTKCRGCPWYRRCWPIPGVSYRMDVMRDTCSNPEVIEALDTIKELTSDKGRSSLFYAIRGEWYSCEELLEVL